MEVNPIDLSEGLAFVAGVREGTLITLRRDGRPQSSDVHHGVDGDTIVFSVLPDRAKVYNVERDQRVVYHVSHEGSYLERVVPKAPVGSRPNVGLSIGVQSGPPIGEQKGPPWCCID